MSKFSEFENERQNAESLRTAELSSSLKDERYRDDTKHRKILVLWVIVLSSLWLLNVCVIMYLCGGAVFNYDTPVLITLLATTTATVLGLPLVVLRGLFEQ